MDSKPVDIWIAACAHRLQQHWRTVDPIELEAVADEIARDPRLRALPPHEAAAQWLRPVASGHEHPGRNRFLD
ncbi:hypothetical protein WKW80_24225 [Variovorax humicola]|uniref:Uncharacterized protein n=1 Tax=Variovorax humicola TaxID=1769758 RepID=A0ABU8W6T6_9BURK